MWNVCIHTFLTLSYTPCERAAQHYFYSRALTVEALALTVITSFFTHLHGGGLHNTFEYISIPHKIKAQPAPNYYKIALVTAGQLSLYITCQAETKSAQQKAGSTPSNSCVNRSDSSLALKRAIAGEFARRQAHVNPSARNLRTREDGPALGLETLSSPCCT